MAIYYARKSGGNINATDVWATTPTGAAGDFFPSFTNADTLMANGFTITINVNTTVLEIRNDPANGATAGGTFALSNNITLTANIIGASCSGFSGTGSAFIVGNLTGNSHQATNYLAAAANNSTGTLTITGSVTAGSIQLSIGANNASTGTMIIIGNVAGGTGNSTFGASNGSNGALIITGNVTGTTSNGVGVSNVSSGSVTITGNVTGGTNGTATGASNSSTGTITITGSCTAGSTGSAVINSSTGTVTINGTCTGAAVVGASNSSTGTLTVTRAKGGPLATSAVGVSSGNTSITNVEEIEYGDLGASPTSGPIRLTNKTSNVAIVYRFGTTKKTLVDTASTSLLPAASDVRNGIVYNASQTTGTMNVPPAQSVSSGVSVDNTVGIAAISSSAIQDSCNNALTSFSSGRLSNIATVSSTGQQLTNTIGA